MVSLLEHILTVASQSLGVGSQGLPSLSPVTEATNAFVVNPTTGALTELKTAAGNQRPDLSLGYRLAQASPAQTFGLSTHAQSGQMLSQLTKGGTSTQYEKAIACAQAAWNAQVATGGASHIGPLHQEQGEADQTFDTPFATYLAQHDANRADYQADLTAITGQSGAIPWIISQTATWAYYGNAARIGLAHLELARTRPNVYAVGGQYQLPYHEGLHLTNVGYYRLGELHARAHAAVVAGLGWAPFAPTAISLTDTEIVVTFHVPTGALEFDTTTVAAQPNKGFSLVGTTRTIMAATITAADQVTLTLSGKITEAGARVGYGIAYGTGPGLGNLCDGETGTSAYDGSRLANWALHFSDPLPVAEANPFYSLIINRWEYRTGSYYPVTI